jgi:spore coat polysaccharide biosynthesis protein SpsF
MAGDLGDVMRLAVLQARMSSSRLPGKVLKPILGLPMLQHQIQRVQAAQQLDMLVVATSSLASDDPVAAMCQQLGVHCFRGALDDVLDRFYQAVRPYQPAHVVRLTGDCPLTDPMVIDRVVEVHQTYGFDYTSNVHPASFPDGLDVEVMTMAALEKAFNEGSTPGDREHVTPFLYHHPSRFRLGNVVFERNLADWRWTVDNPADFDWVSSIYETLYPTNKCFSLSDILALLQQHPDRIVQAPRHFGAAELTAQIAYQGE